MRGCLSFFFLEYPLISDSAAGCDNCGDRLARKMDRRNINSERASRGVIYVTQPTL